MGQQTVQVLNYAQGRQLSETYLHNYAPHKKQAAWVGPSPACTYLRRTNPAREAIILGHVDVLEENGTLTARPAAAITLDEKTMFTDTNGNFAREVAAGRLAVWVTGVGFLRSVVPKLRVVRGDSIAIHFRTLPEFRPTIN